MGKRIQVDITPILADYKAGLAIKVLGAKYGMARGTVRRLLVEAGVRIRTASDQMFCMHKRLTPAERAARAERAQAAVRGSTKTDATMDMAAARRQIQGNATANERLWAHVIMEFGGVPTVPQYAVGRFNVDLAVPDVKVAIEVQCGWHNTPRKRAADIRKRQALDAAGWFLYDVSMPPTVAMGERIANHVKDLRQES